MSRNVSVLVSLLVHLAMMLILAIAGWATHSMGAITISAAIAVADEPIRIQILELEFEGNDGLDDALSIAAGMPISEVSLVGDYSVGQGGEGTGTVGGVPIHGSVTLVCDASGSMWRDLNPLLTELAEKFPGSKVIFTVGCSLLRDPGDVGETISYDWMADFDRRSGVNLDDFSGSLEFDFAANPTIAIRRAMRDSTAGVLFNCDLQDGISREGVGPLIEEFVTCGKPLSVRSLHRDSPAEFTEMLESTGGVFRLDAVGRSSSPARPMLANYKEYMEQFEAMRLEMARKRREAAEAFSAKLQEKKQSDASRDELIRLKRMQRARARRNRR